MFGFVRVHISLYADFDIELNLLSEDHQDFAPEDETHNVSIFIVLSLRRT